MNRARRVLVFAFVTGACLAGCGHVCDEPTRTPIGLNDETPLGVTAAEVVEKVEGSYYGALAWGASSGVSMTAAGSTNVSMKLSCGTGSIELVDIPWSIEMDCDLQMTTEDGAFDDTLRVLLTQQSMGSPSPSELRPITLWGRIPQVGLNGSFMAASSDPAYTSSSVSLHLEWVESSKVKGQVDFQQSREFDGGELTGYETLGRLQVTRVP